METFPLDFSTHNRAEYENADLENLNPNTKRILLRKTHFEIINELMSAYWYEVRRRNIPITGPILKAQARKYADKFKLDEIRCFFIYFV